MKSFSNTDQLRSFMKKESDRLGISIGNAYTTYISRAFLERVSKYNNGHVLVKGSSAATAYLGRLVRGITDVDLAMMGSIEENDDLIRYFMEEEPTSPFSFQLVRDPKVTPTGIYQMSFESTFDKTRQPLRVDLQENYNRLIEREERIMPAVFEGDLEFKVLVPSFEEFLAEKLCIILESNKTDVLNTRVKDFYDIYELHGGKYDPEKLTKYFGQMLALRGKIKLQDASTLYLDKDFISQHEDLWKIAKKKYDFLDDDIDLYGAVYYARAVLREELQKNGSIMPVVVRPKQFVKTSKTVK
ncbi:MAG: nucleotidyl transferase AbiEii/AbiGii toxin family protein [Bacilli bacterium]|nr:nucleotidyl transferase AbiEii/AbiGii toxin family protein [Bacilli bacterium]